MDYPSFTKEREELRQRFNGKCAYTLTMLDRIIRRNIIKEVPLVEQMKTCDFTTKNDFEYCQCLTKIWKSLEEK
jgi:hypothetical protein